MVVSFVIEPWSLVAGFVLGSIVTFVAMAVIAVRMRNQQEKQKSVSAEVVKPVRARTRKAK